MAMCIIRVTGILSATEKIERVVPFEPESMTRSIEPCLPDIREPRGKRPGSLNAHRPRPATLKT